MPFVELGEIVRDSDMDLLWLGVRRTGDWLAASLSSWATMSVQPVPWVRRCTSAATPPVCTFGLVICAVGDGDSIPANLTVRLFGAGLSETALSCSREPRRCKRDILVITVPVLT